MPPLVYVMPDRGELLYWDVYTSLIDPKGLAQVPMADELTELLEDDRPLSLSLIAELLAHDKVRSSRLAM